MVYETTSHKYWFVSRMRIEDFGGVRGLNTEGREWFGAASPQILAPYCGGWLLFWVV
jgi:hypothetical protein